MQELKLPQLGDNITQGTLTKVLVKVGDRLEKGQNILELETDKAVLEVPSNAQGVVKEILVKAGAVLKPGQAVFTLEDSVASPTPALAPAGPTAIEPKISETVPTSLEKTPPLIVPATPQGVALSNSLPHPVRKDIAAAPSVRLLARELGIDIGQVPSSSANGRISIEDVKSYCKTLNTTGPAPNSNAFVQHPLPNFAKWGEVRRTAMNNVRKKTAEHLSFAWNSIPHVTQCDKVDITELEKLRKNLGTNGKKISVTPFIIKVVAAALKKFPQFNASVDMLSQEIIFKDYVNVGVAVDTDRGLLVPVLKNVDTLSIIQISDALTAIAERARLRKTTLDEMQGGCFTISNLGGIGGSHFTPIVNWPEVAILGVSRGALEPIYIDGHFMPRLMLPVSLSYDHRLIDGADGARFLRWICEAIQQPFLLDLNK